MATFVQSKSSDMGSVTSGSITFTNTTVAGNLIVAGARVSATGRTLTVTDNKSNTFTQRNSQVQTTDGHDLFGQDSANIAAGASHQVTFAISGAAASVRAVIMEGNGPTSTPFDKTTKAEADGTTLVSSGNTTTTAQANEWLVGLVSTAGGGATTTLTGGTGYNVREQVLSSGNLKIAIEERDVSATGTYPADGTLDGTDNYAAVVLTYKLGGGAFAPSEDYWMPSTPPLDDSVISVYC